MNHTKEDNLIKLLSVELEDEIDAEEEDRDIFEDMAMSAMKDIGLTEDEAELMLEDFNY